MFEFFERLARPFVTDARSAQQPATVSEFILSHLLGFKKFTLLVATFAMCTAAAEVYIFKFLGGLVDAMTSSDNFFSDNLSILVQMCLLLLVGLPLAASAHTLLWHQTMEGNLPLRILSTVHQHLTRQPVHFYQTESAGKVANTLLQTAASTKLIIAKLVDRFVFAFVFAVGVIVLVAGIDTYLLAPVLAWFTGYFFVILYFVPKLKDWSTMQAAARSQMVGQMVDTYTNIQTVKLFSHSAWEQDFSRKYMSAYLDTIYGQMRFISKVQFLMWGLNIMLIFSTFAVSIGLWRNELISVGAIAAAVGVAFRIYTMSHWIMWEISGLFSNIGVLQDGIKLLCRPLPTMDGEASGQLDVKKYDISFKNIRFSHGDPGNLTIDQVSLDIGAGEKIGIIGPSGSGKSTLTKLLLRFYEPDSGEITIGGKNIRSLDRESLWEQIGVVAQDVELLDRSIRENLIYGKRDASEEEMIEAAKAAGAHEFILELVDENGCRGYDARVGVRGAKLSGGQRQRISLARALIKNAPILIFDEATSALDSEAESHIMKFTKKYIDGKTVIMVAHRLSTLATMDRLAIIENGKLVELGSHDELKAGQGRYTKLLNMQADKAMEGALAA